MKNNLVKYFCLCLFISLPLGCIDDRISPELNFSIESAIELLKYLESQGDYINSSEIFDFVSANEVFENRNTYLIIDVRSQIDFFNGHIENAVNIKPENLFGYIKSVNASNFSKIILISESGQSAAYYCALLRFAGYSNVHSLEYGMAVWHQDFADIWINAIRDFRAEPDQLNYYTNDDFPKPSTSKLPQLIFSEFSKTVKEKLDERISKLLSEGFNERIGNSFISHRFSQSQLSDERTSLLVDSLYESYNGSTRSFTNHFVICFGKNDLYKAHKLEGPFADRGHLPSAVKYEPQIDLRSTNDLQTIPASKIVVIYDVNGQVSPKITAYLRVLGYDARSLLFGANNLFYSRVNWVGSLSPFAFKQEMIMNYPYVIGGTIN